jgi:membrane-associated protein
MLDIHYLIDLFLHVDKHLSQLLQEYGTLTYVILFAVVFCETGLVITPFLPGDSLLFAAGALSATGGLEIHRVALAIFIAAILGDAVNYSIGHYIGPRAFIEGDPGFLRRHFLKYAYLKRTEEFYVRYGGKAIILARFVPIIRTFAPFLAGIGTMSYPRFALYNIGGAALWVGLFVYGGYFFGTLPFVRDNFSLVIIAIILLSIMPIVIETIKARRSCVS